MPDKKDIVDAMLREAAGYDARRTVAEEELAAGPETATRREYLERVIQECKEGAKNAVAELKFYGWKPEAPARRAEKRPAAAKETR